MTKTIDTPSRGPAEFLVYQTEDGQTRYEVRFDGDTAWLSLGQMTELFQRDKSVISRHIKNVFDEGELTSEATVAESATVQQIDTPLGTEHGLSDKYPSTAMEKMPILICPR